MAEIIGLVTAVIGCPIFVAWSWRSRPSEPPEQDQCTIIPVDSTVQQRNGWDVGFGWIVIGLLLLALAVFLTRVPANNFDSIGQIHRNSFIYEFLFPAGILSIIGGFLYIKHTNNTAGIVRTAMLQYRSQEFAGYNRHGSARITSITVEYGIVRDGVPGMTIHAVLQVGGMKDKRGQIAAYFSFGDGSPLKDYDGNY